MSKVSVALVALVACKGGGDTGGGGDSGGNGGGGGEVTFESFINTSTEAVGSLECFAGGDWLTQEVDPATQVDFPADGTVLDFQDEVGVADVNVEIYLSDTFGGMPDVTGVTDTDGKVPFTGPACTPVTYKTWTDPSRGLTKDTFEAHQIWDYPSTGTMTADFDSVSTDTYNIIPAVLGVSPDPSMGAIAGTAFDCNGDPIQHAQVIVQDDNGDFPTGMTIKYFVDKFPNRDQPDTSEDGLWVAINVPVGDWNVNMYTVQGGTLVLTGATRLHVEPDSINVSNIYTGFGDGVKYPPECLVQASQ